MSSDPKATPDKSKPRKREGGAEHVVVRNLIAQAVLRRMIVLVLLAGICALVSALAAWQVSRVKTPPQYVQLTEDGRILQIAPLTTPNVADGEILRFAMESVKWINTYDHQNWKDQLQSNAFRFSPTGWNRFMEAFLSTNTLVSVQERHMVVSAIPTGAPRVAKEGIADEVGQYTWLVEVPVRIQYQAPPTGGANNINTQVGVVSLYISRVPLEVSHRGYAIQVYQFDVSTPGSAQSAP